MALIKCPECGREISDKSKQCIHCGYPLDYQETNDNSYDVLFQGFKTNKLKDQNTVKVVAQIRQIMNYDLSTAHSCVKNVPGVICKSTDKKNAEWLKNVLEPYGCIIEITASKEKSGIIKNEKLDSMASEGKTLICSHCGNTNISTGARGFSLLTGFIGSGKTVNRCANCGWKWEP